MKIAILAPSDKTYIKEFLPNHREEDLPEGYYGAPFIGTLIKEFLVLGHEVCAITTTKSINNDYNVKKYSYGKFSWIIVPFRPNSIKKNGEKLGRIVDLFAFEKKGMINALKELEPDFVHAHWSYEFAGAAVKSGYPFLVTIHDNPYVILKYFKNIYRFGRLIMAESNLKRVTNATTVSPYMLEYANKRCNNIKVIPNPVEISFQENEIRALIEHKISTMDKPKIFMINNGWDERKNGMMALTAFKLLLEKFPEASLHLFGSGSEKDGRAFIDSNKIDLGHDRVFFNGKVTREKLLNELKAAHLFLHPALEESFGVVLIESMCMGIPAIGGVDSGAVPWVINEKKLLIDVRDKNRIHDKLLQLLTNNNIYREVALNSYNNVINRFSSKSVAQDYLNYYDEILKKG